MVLNSSNVRVGVTGALSVGGPSAVAPTDADTALGTGWTDAGYVSDSGVEEIRTRSTNKIRGWQNSDTVREVVTEASLQIKATLIETNATTLELYYGIAHVDGKVVVIPSKTGGRKKFNLDVVDGEEFIRAYIAAGEVTEVGNQVYRSGEPIGYEVTITAYPDASIVDADGNVGVMAKWYSSLAGD